MLEFTVNDYITLKLEDSKTRIYVGGKLFDICKHIIIKKRIINLEDILTIESVDEFAEHSQIESYEPLDISPESLFWAHSSNLQVWAENDYDTRLLHSDLAFPLLRRLTRIGDPIAKEVFKEEIGKRMMTGNLNTFYVLLSGGFIDFLDKEEIENFLTRNNKKLEMSLKNALLKRSHLAYPVFYELIKKYHDQESKNILMNFIAFAIENNNYETMDFIINEEEFMTLLSVEEIYQLLLKTVLSDIFSLDVKIKFLFNEILANYKNHSKISFLIRVFQIMTYPYDIKKIKEIFEEELFYRKHYENF